MPNDTLEPIIREPNGGRIYEMGHLRAVFKADEAETGGRFSVSEWWVEPHFDGPGAHKHDENDELFHVTHGTATILVGDTWHVLPTGSTVIIPRGVMHDFRNDGDERLCLFNVYMPGNFEPAMPSIVEWFATHPGTRR